MKHLVVAVVFVVACGKSAKEAPPAGGGAGSAPIGSAEPVAKGSDMAMAGSGSAMAGSAMAGSDTAMAGSGAGSGSAAWDFDKLTSEEKAEFMKTKVVPAMKPMFQTFDAKKYANFGCKTCHGKDPKAAKFKMPNPELPKLDFAALKAGKQAPKVAEFMAKQVKPEMAKLLQQPEMTETNPKGFGCLECHEMKKK